MRAALLVCLLALPRVCHADDEPSRAPLYLSIGSTVALAGTGAALLYQSTDGSLTLAHTGAGLVLGGVLVGPATGDLWAGRPSRAFGFTLARLAFTAGAWWALQGSVRSGADGGLEVDSGRAATAAALGAGALVLAVWELATTEPIRHPPRFAIAPTLNGACARVVF